MIEIVPSETGRFRNVVPQSGEESIRESEKAAWEVTI